MKQIIPNQTWEDFSVDAITSIWMTGSANQNFGVGAQHLVSITWPTPGTFSNLVITGDDDGAIWTLYKDDVATSLTATSSGGVGVSSGSVTVAVGERYYYRRQGPVRAWPTSYPVSANIEFDSGSAYISAYGIPPGTGFSAGGSLGSYGLSGSPPNSNTVSLCPIAGTVTTIVVNTRFDGIDATKGVRATLYKNGVAQDGSGGTPDAQVSLMATATGFLYASATIALTVAVGDRLETSITSINGYVITSAVGSAIEFTATLAGRFAIVGSNATGQGPGGPYSDASVYGSVPGWWGTDEHVFRGAFNTGAITPFHLTKLQWFASAAYPAGTGPVVFKLVKNGTDPANQPTLTVVTNDTYVADTDASHVVPIALGDTWSLNAVPTAIGAVQAHWSFEAFVATPIPVQPPSAAQAPCTPQTPVSSGGKGAAGCNTGGVGRVTSYTGPFGTVPDHADPADGESLMNKEGVGIEPWIELIHIDYPSGTPTTYRRAMVELDDRATYEGGRKTEGLLAIGDEEHALGNEQGTLEAGTLEIEFTDAVDAFWKTLLDTQDLEGDEIYVKMASDPGRVAGADPRIMFRGIITKAIMRSVRRVAITAVDVLFAEGGPFGPDSQFPNWRFGDLGQATPNLTADLKDVPIPVLYGEKTDEGARHPLTGALNPKGLLPGYYLGMFDLSGVAGVPGASSVQPSTKTLVEVVAELQASVNAGTTVADWSAIIGVNDAIALEAMGTVPSSYTALAQVIGYGDLDALLAQPSSTPPSPTLNQWGFLAFGLGCWFMSIAVYGSDLGLGNATMTHDRILLDPASRSDILVPGLNWPAGFTTNYTIFINPDTGQEFWIYGIWVRGPLLDDHINGVVNITMNAIGIEDVGDGSGLPLVDVHDIEQHWFENHVLNKYSSGLYVTTVTFPQYSDGTPKVKSSSFTTRQAFTATMFGGRGLVGSLYFDTRKDTRSHAADLAAWTESRTGTDHHGQILKYGLDETLSTATWPRIEHVTDLYGPLVRTSGEERENVQGGQCDYDPDTGLYRVGPIEPLVSALGVAKYKNRRKEARAIQSNGILFDKDALIWVLTRRLQRLQLGTTLIQGALPVGWLDYDVGDGVLVTSDEGTGVNGYVDHPFIILRRRFNFLTRLVTFTLWDVRDVLIATAFSGGLSQLFYETNDPLIPIYETNDPTLAPLEVL